MKRMGRPPHPDILTPREWEVLDLLRRGLNNPQIAQILEISRDGAKYHVSEIIGKLGVTNRFEAAAWQAIPVPWWRIAFPAFLAWPFNNLWWGSAAKATLAAAVVATVVTLYPVPEGYDISVNYGHTGADVFVVTADDMAKLVSSQSNDALATWSPDCSRIAFNSNRTTPSGDRFEPGNQNIWVMNADGTDPVQLTDIPGGGARWSPDGTRIAFRRPERGEGTVPPHGQPPLKSTDIFVINADGSGETRLTDGWGIRELTAWSPDGKRMLLNFAQPDLSWFDSVTWGVDEETLEIYVMNSDGTDMKNLSNRPGLDSHAQLSPDGKLIAFQSTRGDGTDDIFVMDADGGNVRRLTDHPASDMQPYWSPDGKWISFTSYRPVSLERRMEILRAEDQEAGTSLSEEQLRSMAEQAGRRRPRDIRKLANVWMMKAAGSEVQHVVEGWGGGWSACKAQR